MPSYIYTWHERRLNLIKIGSSADPPTRMLNYGLAMHLSPSPASLRSIKLNNRTNAKQVMTACHNLLKSMHLMSAQQANELYGLRHHTYGEVSTAVLRAAMVAETELMNADNDNASELMGHRPVRKIPEKDSS